MSRRSSNFSMREYLQDRFGKQGLQASGARPDYVKIAKCPISGCSFALSVNVRTGAWRCFRC